MAPRTQPPRSKKHVPEPEAPQPPPSKPATHTCPRAKAPPPSEQDRLITAYHDLYDKMEATKNNIIASRSSKSALARAGTLFLSQLVRISFPVSLSANPPLPGHSGVVNEPNGGAVPHSVAVCSTQFNKPASSVFDGSTL